MSLLEQTSQTRDAAARSLSERIAALPDRQKVLLRIELDKRDGRPEPIAVIGMGCRFPGEIDDPAAFWDLLSDGRDAVGLPPAARPRLGPLEGKAAPVRPGGYLGPDERIAQFDPAVFRIAPREAARMDPQQRLLLETAWSALEDAGQDLRQLAGTDVGVFVGISAAEYGYLQLARETVHAHTHTGGALSVAANRISYSFDFRGPSMAVDTACSSSLVAVHLAIRSLRDGESSMALAGGVNLLLTPEVMRGFEEMGVLSRAGRCAAFSDEADGIVRGEGAGLLVLKKLSAAIRDRDPIHALVRGGAVNQDGRSYGLTAPNRRSQEEVLRRAYRDAGVDPREVAYVEAHGTGTRLGDPIEAEALGAVLGEGRATDRLCRLGSVKTNLGHLESAAGVAGLIKTILMLEHRRFVPNLHFKRPNPLIPFPALGLRVATTAEDWTRGDGPRLAGVSSFGFGGTNAHIVLEEGPRIDEPPAPDSIAAQTVPRLFVLSAADRRALVERVSDLAQGLPADAPPAGARPGSHYDLCYTAALRRTPMDVRLAVVSEDRADLAAKLAAGLDDPAAVTGEIKDLAAGPVFVFSGQGPVWWPLDKRLLKLEAEFARTLEECAEYFHELGGFDLMTELFRADGPPVFTDPYYLLPGHFSIQAAQLALWRARGIEPAAVIGHSTGEITAAHAAGVLNLEDACRVFFHRGRLFQRLNGEGRMAMAELSRAEAEAYLQDFEGRLVLAAVNGLKSVVFSGAVPHLAELGRRLEAAGVFFREVEAIKVAAHSPIMDAVLPELRESLAGMKNARPIVPFFSTVTGGLFPEAPTVEHWVRNYRETVRFLDALEAVLDAGHVDFMEIGPHPVFSSFIQQSLDRRGLQGQVLRGMRRGKEAVASLLETTGRLFVAGFPVRFDSLFPEPGEVVPQPPYPFRREAYWFGADGQDRIPAPETHTDGAPQALPRVSGAGLRAAEESERLRLLEDLVRYHAGRVLGVSSVTLDVDRPLRAFGMDSLMAVEIKNSIEDQIGVPLNAAEILKGGSVRSCAAVIAAKPDWRGDSAESEPTGAAEEPEAAEAAEAETLPLTAPQAWFFDHGIVSPHHWNLSVILETPSEADADRLREAVRRVRERHAVYRLRFVREQAGVVRQFFPAASAEQDDDCFRTFDLSELSSADFSERVERESEGIQRSLNIYEGPLFRVAYFDAGPERAGRILIVMHHLITDGFGFALFLAEVRAEFLALGSAEPAPRRVTPLSYRNYTRRMLELAATPEIRDQLAYWTSESHTRAVPSLPRDFPDGLLVDGSLVTVTDHLDRDQTALFLHDPRRSKNFNPQLLLLGAVNRSFARWTGGDLLRVELETHGRDAHGVDATRMHGWCNVMYPLLLAGGNAATPRRTLELIDANLAEVPEEGGGFQLLRYQSADESIRRRLAALPAPEVKVIYHGGVFEQIRSAAAPFAPAPESPGPNYANDNRPKYSIYVYGAVYEECFHVQLLYSENLFRKETMLNLLEGIKLELISLLAV